MLINSRNNVESNDFLLSEFNEYQLLDSFDCGNKDLNDYFKIDAVLHRQELLSKTYSLTSNIDSLPFPIALIDLCNDSVRKDKVKDLPFIEEIPEQKRYFVFPAVKITRLGVHVDFQKNNIGTFLLNMVKELFLNENRTGCRLITVDAYNQSKVLQFYHKNHFNFFSDKDVNKQTRAMFFDLKQHLTL